MEYYSFNDRFFGGNQLSIDVNSKALRYGNGIFETLYFDGAIIRNFHFHFERVTNSIALFAAALPQGLTEHTLHSSILNLCAKNNLKRARVRLSFFIGTNGLFEQITKPHVDVLIQCFNVSPTISDWNENGLQLGLYTAAIKCADAFSNIKHNNFLPYQMAAKWAKEQQFNDAILCNQFGRVADTCIANLFIVNTNGDIVTPPLSDGPIAGIQRRFLLEQLPTLGFKVFEQGITLKDLYTAKECFITNALSPLRWVANINNGPLLQNETSVKIFAALFSKK